MAIKGIFDDFPKIPKKEIEVERVWPSLEELKDRVEISKLKDEGAKYYYNYLDEYLGEKGKNYSEDDLIRMSSRYLSDSTETAYFYIKHYIGEIGEAIGEIFYKEGRFAIYIKKEFRNKGYGQMAMEEFYNYAFLYNMDIKNCNSLTVDLNKGDCKLENFFCKCGFELDCEFHDGDKRFEYLKTKYYKFEVCDIKESDLELYNKYIDEFQNSKFKDKFNKLIKKNIKYQHVCLKKTYDDGRVEIVGLGYYKKTNKIPGSFAYVEINPRWKRDGYGSMFMRMLFRKFDYDYIYLSCSWKEVHSIKFLYSLKPDDVYPRGNKLIFHFQFVVY